MQVPHKPPFFDLNELQCRLIAARIVFQKLMQARKGKQLNVPADMSSTVGMLPRLPEETATIKVNLNRRLQYKSSVLSLTVRPNNVITAAIWLLNNSDLYKEEGIALSENWLNNYKKALVGDIQSNYDES